MVVPVRQEQVSKPITRLCRSDISHLEVGLVLNQLLRSSMKQPNMRIRSNDLLSVKLQNQPQHTMGSGMLRTLIIRSITMSLLPFVLFHGEKR